MADNDFGFTEKESKLMASAWLCFEDKPKIDFDKLAGLNGYTNPRSCVNAWSAIKKKLAAQEAKQEKSAAGSGTEGAEGDAPKSVKAKATPKKRGKKAADEDVDDDESPTKKVKATPRKRTATPKKRESDEDVIKTEKDDAGEDEDLLA